MLPELAHQRLLQFQNVVVNSISLKGSGFPTPVLHTSNKPEHYDSYSLNDNNG